MPTPAATASGDSSWIRHPWRGWSTSSSSCTWAAPASASAIPAILTGRPAHSATSRCCCCPATRRPAGSRGRASAGACTELAVRGRGLGADVPVRIWSPADADPAEPLPLLVAHDGPEYERLSALTHFAAVAIGARELPRHRLALLGPGERDEWYSASARYAGALVRDVLPAIRAAVAVAASQPGSARASAGSRCCTPSAAIRAPSGLSSCSPGASSRRASTARRPASRATRA